MTRRFQVHFLATVDHPDCIPRACECQEFPRAAVPRSDWTVPLLLCPNDSGPRRYAGHAGHSAGSTDYSRDVILTGSVKAGDVGDPRGLITACTIAIGLSCHESRTMPDKTRGLRHSPGFWRGSRTRQAKVRGIAPITSRSSLLH
jgi:hypothetical protein